MGLADALPQDPQLSTDFDAPPPQAEPPVASYAPPPQVSDYQPPPGPMSVQPPASAMPYPGVTSGVAPGAAPPPVRPDPAALLALARQGMPGRKAGYTPSSRTVEGTAYSPETIDATGQELAANRDVAGAQLDAEAQQGASAGQMGQHLRLYDELDAQAANLRQYKREETLKGYHDHIDSLMQTATEAGRINPGHYMQSKGLAGQIGLALAAGLGGAGGALTHQGNAVLDMINHGIDQDVDAQKETAQNAKSAVGQAVNLYQLNREKLGDDERAEQATKLAQRQSYISFLQSQVDQANAPASFRLHAATVMQGLSQQNATLLRDLDEKTVHQVTHETFQQATAPGGGDVLATLKRANAIGDETQKLSGTSIEQRKGEAELGKTRAETQAEEAKAGAPAKETDRFEAAAGDLGSNSFWEHPVDALLLQHFQGTDAATKARTAQAYNLGVAGDVAKLVPGIARNPEKLQEMAGVYLIQPNDTEATIKQKVALRRQNLIGAKAPAIGTTEGVAPDEAP